MYRWEEELFIEKVKMEESLLPPVNTRRAIEEYAKEWINKIRMGSWGIGTAIVILAIYNLTIPVILGTCIIILIAITIMNIHFKKELEAYKDETENMLAGIHLDVWGGVKPDIVVSYNNDGEPIHVRLRDDPL